MAKADLSFNNISCLLVLKIKKAKLLLYLEIFNVAWQQSQPSIRWSGEFRDRGLSLSCLARLTFAKQYIYDVLRGNFQALNEYHIWADWQQLNRPFALYIYNERLHPFSLRTSLKAKQQTAYSFSCLKSSYFLITTLSASAFHRF